MNSTVIDQNHRKIDLTPIDQRLLKEPFLYTVKDNAIVKKSLLCQVVAWLGYMIQVIFCRQKTYLHKTTERLFNQLVDNSYTSTKVVHLSPLTPTQQVTADKVASLFPGRAAPKKPIFNEKQEPLVMDFLTAVVAQRAKSLKVLEQGFAISTESPCGTALALKQGEIYKATDSIKQDQHAYLKILFERALIMNTQLHTDTLHPFKDNPRHKNNLRDYHRRFSFQDSILQKANWKITQRNPFIGTREIAFKAEGKKMKFSVPLDLSPLGKLTYRQFDAIIEFLKTFNKETVKDLPLNNQQKLKFLKIAQEFDQKILLKFQKSLLLI